MEIKVLLGVVDVNCLNQDLRDYRIFGIVDCDIEYELSNTL